MSFPLQGQQGTQRSLVHGLRFKSSISPIRLSLVAEGDITAPSSPTNATSPCDTSDAISVYDPTDIDPFKCQARPSVPLSLCLSDPPSLCVFIPAMLTAPLQPFLFLRAFLRGSLKRGSWLIRDIPRYGSVTLLHRVPLRDNGHIQCYRLSPIISS